MVGVALVDLLFHHSFVDHPSLGALVLNVDSKHRKYLIVTKRQISYQMNKLL